MTRLRFRLKDLRIMRAMTQHELAQAIGVRQATINDLENGKTRQETWRLLERLCEVLEVGPADLFQLERVKRVERRRR